MSIGSHNHEAHKTLTIDEYGSVVWVDDSKGYLRDDMDSDADLADLSSCTSQTRAGCRALPDLFQDLMSEQDTKFIALYTVLLLGWILGELANGCWPSSIAFISDAMHMIFDVFCVSTSLGAMLLNRVQNARSFTFSYGFERLEVLSGFVNTALLVLASGLLVTDAVHRTLYNDVSHCTEGRSLLLPFYSLSLNLGALALLRFRHPNIGRSHVSIHEYGGRHINLAGVGLHMLSDACESAGHLFAGSMLSWKGWVWGQVSISMAVAGIVTLCAYPILRDSSSILLHATPEAIKGALTKSLRQVNLIEGVSGLKEARFWSLAPGTFIGSLRIEASEDGDEGLIQALARESFCGVIQHITIQVEKPRAALDSANQTPSNPTGISTASGSQRPGRASAPGSHRPGTALHVRQSSMSSSDHHSDLDNEMDSETVALLDDTLPV